MKILITIAGVGLAWWLHIGVIKFIAKTALEAVNDSTGMVVYVKNYEDIRCRDGE